MSDFDVTSFKNRDVHRANRLCVGDIAARVATTFPHRTAIVAAEEAASAYEEYASLTYAELDTLANRFGNAITDHGLGPGDKVFTYCRNATEFLAIQLGIAKTEVVAVVGNPLFPNDVLGHVIDEAEPDAAIVDTEVYRADRELFENHDLEPSIYLPTEGDIDTGTGFQSAVADQPETEPAADIQPTDVFQLMYTSGTTGPAKGVMHSHLYMYTCTSNHNMRLMRGLPPVTDVVGSHFYPMSHIATQSHMMTNLLGQDKGVLLREPTPETFAAAITEYEINVINVISPYMLRQLLSVVEENPAEYSLDSLQFVIWGFGPLDPDIVERYEELSEGEIRFALMNGQTESVLDTTFWVDENREKFEENCPNKNYFGRSAPLFEVVALDEDDRIASSGEGNYEKAMRSPCVMEGYYKKPEQTAEAFENGWLHSGDLGYMDEDNLFVFTGRSSDMIMSGGENVMAGRVEGVIREHPAVDEVAVFGLPHERWGEAVTAAVVLHPDEDLTEDDILEYCRSEQSPLAGYEIPKGVIFLEELPMTVGEKKQKFKLENQYEDYYR